MAICGTGSAVLVAGANDRDSAGALAAVCVAAGASPAPFNAAVDASAVCTVEADPMTGIGPMKSGSACSTIVGIGSATDDGASSISPTKSGSASMTTAGADCVGGTVIAGIGPIKSGSA